jgi:hypothetical protein
MFAVQMMETELPSVTIKIDQDPSIVAEVVRSLPAVLFPIILLDRAFI